MDVHTLRVEEAAKMLGIGRSSAYAAARRRELPVLKIDGRLLVSKPALERMLAEAGRESEEERR